MHVSRESPEQTERRLRKVIASARVKRYDAEYVFIEYPLTTPPLPLPADALAAVRDDTVWSVLLPARDSPGERFRIFRFHFPPSVDNSGFVGWLATHLKRAVGTGVFVVCGQNSADGGIFDYWGCPSAVGDRVTKELEHLIYPENSST